MTYLTCATTLPLPQIEAYRYGRANFKPDIFTDTKYLRTPLVGPFCRTRVDQGIAFEDASGETSLRLRDRQTSIAK